MSIPTTVEWNLKPITSRKLENSQICGNETSYSWTTIGSKRKTKWNFKSISSENKNTAYQNLWDAAKVVLRGNFILINAYIKKEERSQINKLTLNFKELEKEQAKSKVSRKKEIIKIRTEIKQVEKLKYRKDQQNYDLCSFWKDNNIDKLLARLRKKERTLKLGQDWKRWYYNIHFRNKKDHETIMNNYMTTNLENG